MWLFDPDVGLIPNWPLGLIIGLAMLFFILRFKRDKIFSMEGFFIAAYLSINLFAQSSTINLNSGATPGLARYALWYIPIFYPFAVFLGSLLRARSNFYLTASVFAGLTIYFGINSYLYDPRQPESYASPSRFSGFIQTYAPSLYDPPYEIFLERFSGSGESATTHALSAVVGPSCDKALIFPSRDSNQFSIPDRCALTKDTILKEISEAAHRSPEPRYIRISGGGTPPIMHGTGSYSFGDGGLGLGLLGSGWHRAEPWGVWSKAPALLSVPCTPGEASIFQVELTIRPFTPPQHASTYLRITSGKDLLFEGALGQKVQDIPILVHRSSCDSKNQAAITIAADQFRSPKELALSDDDRLLGVGLEKIHYPDR